MVRNCGHKGKAKHMHLGHRHLPEFRSPKGVPCQKQQLFGRSDTLIQKL